MRDQSVRVEFGISVRRAARLAGVNRHTLEKYELDPASIANPKKRRACERLFAELRATLERVTAEVDAA